MNALQYSIVVLPKLDNEAEIQRLREKFDPWFYQILRRLCFNHNRDRRGRQAKLREAARWLCDQAERRAPAEDPQVAAEREESRARVRRAIEALPPRQRETMRLRVSEGLTYDEIAARLGVGRDAVRMNLIEARRKLLRRFEGDLP